MTNPLAPSPDSGSVSANLSLKVGSYELQATLTVPAAPIKPQAVLPALQALVDAVVGAAERELEGTGRSVSCKPGCAACCRQAVSISAVEAYHVRDLVEAMPAARRDTVLARFADVRRQVEGAGLYDKLMDPTNLSADQRETMALDYLALGIACPFLDDESCSIYADRPLRCREYLVTSPAERCATPGRGDLEPVAVPKLSRALMRTGMADGAPTSWPPLSLALDWVAAHPDDLPLHPGPAWVRDILGRAGDPSTEQPAADLPTPSDDEADPGGIALPMPPGEVSAVDMLPTFRAYTEAAVAHAIDFSVSQGKPPSCRAGCSACCRHQLIAITTLEARRIATIVEEMPEPRQSHVRLRFADADRRIAAWTESTGHGIGLNHDRQTEDERLASFFALGIVCPLLENDSCSIYAERPLVCREYLVTTPAENCARLEEAGVTVEAIPRMFTDVALAHLVSDDIPPRPSRVLLGQSLSWVAANPEPGPPPRRTAEAWLNRFFDRLGHVDDLGPQRRQQEAAEAAPVADTVPESGELRLDVPAHPVKARAVLPAFRAITDVSVQQSIAHSEARGKPVSCKPGCSACCNQLVPVGAIEAHALAELVASLPEPRRGIVRSRFVDAEARLSAWEHRGKLDDVDHPPDLSSYQLGIGYFRLGIACPFLDDGMCSIYTDRPMACREHLVTSPADFCGSQGEPGTTVEAVAGSGASQALVRLADDDGAASAGRIPLTLALSWAATHPETTTELPGRLWIERMLAFLRGLR